MKREKSVSKKKPKELKVNWVVSGVNQHLANALQIATAECALLAAGRAAAEARVRELEDVLKQRDIFVSSALPVTDAA